MSGRPKNEARNRTSTARRNRRRPAASTSWDALAKWYDGWVGEGGSEHHRELAVPALLRLLDPRRGERVLDLGAGQGVLAPAVVRAGASYTGVDASPRLIQLAKQHHPRAGRFLVGDVRKLTEISPLRDQEFDAAVFLLSIQDMDPLEEILGQAASVLRPGARLVLVLTHPAFRIPRQSGWGWDEGRKLVYRRIDRYLTPLAVPLKPLPGTEMRTTRSFHRSISAYVNALSDAGLRVDRMEEVPGNRSPSVGETKRSEELARREIPLFLGLRAVKELKRET